VLTVAEALDRIGREIEPLPAEEVPAALSAGRVLAADAAAAADFPSFDTTAMDGYAVAGAGPSWRDRAGTIAAGAAPGPPLSPGEAARVMTGAPIPPGTEAIVPVEDAELSGGEIRARAAPKPGAHIRGRGEIFRAGETLLGAGERVSPEGVLLLVTAGAGTVSARRLPGVVIAATGAEIVEADAVPGPGQIRNGNGPALAAALGRRAISPRAEAPVPDALDRLEAFFDGVRTADLVLTTGGVSAGDYDRTVDAAVRSGFDLLFHRVRVKPGMPIAFGRRGPTFWFGLPGNPVSALTTAAVFVDAALDRFEGVHRDRFVTARLADPIDATPGRDQFRDAILSVADGELAVAPLASRGSHDVRAQARRNALVLLPAGGGPWRAGERMRCLPLGCWTPAPGPLRS
jgi:molybdopterin molybdotransferase